LNEKFILLKDSSDRIGILYQSSDRIGFVLDNFGSDRILNISQLSDYKRPIRCTPLIIIFLSKTPFIALVVEVFLDVRVVSNHVVVSEECTVLEKTTRQT
jgi:hypothetical protein